MPRIIFLEDCVTRLGVRLLPELHDETKRNFGSRRRWVTRQCSMQNEQDALQQIRSWLNDPEWSNPLILSIDSQVSGSDHEKVLGIRHVYAGLLQNPGVRWLGLAIISEHANELRPEILGTMKELVRSLHDRINHKPRHAEFWGASTGAADVSRFVSWANGIATAEGIEK